GHRTGDRAKEERGDHRGGGEAGAEQPLEPQLGHGLAEGEGGTPQDHPERHRHQRDVQSRHDRGEGGREPGPEHHQDEDQPDMVGLPHRPDRVLDQGPLTSPAVGPAGDQVPGAGAEVGPAQQGVGGHPDPDHGQEDLGQGHVTFSSTTSCSWGATGSGRRASRRSTYTVATVISVYTTSSTYSPNRRPGAELTASLVRMYP